MILTIEDEVKPIIFAERDGGKYTARTLGKEKDLMGVLCEKFENYIVYWPHWSFDDFRFRLNGSALEDYEPIILIILEGVVSDVGIRPHGKYRHRRDFVLEGGRPLLMFRGSWHEPHIYWGDVGLQKFMQEKCDRVDDYTLVYDIPPQWYVKDDAKKSVYEFAQELVNDLISGAPDVWKGP